MSPLFLVPTPSDYPIALYSGVSCLSTTLRLRPAFCLYEQWLRASVDPSEAPRGSATIEVQVQPTGKPVGD